MQHIKNRKSLLLGVTKVKSVPVIAKVLKVRSVAESTYVLTIDRNGFAFEPGQSVTLGVRGEPVNREYSIYSGANDKELEFIIREVKQGTLSPALRKMQPGSEVDLYGPYGKFTLNLKELARPHYLIATGTGIAPFHSYVRTAKDELNYTILHGVREVEECYEAGEYAPKRYIPCVSKNPGKFFHGRVTDYLNAQPNLNKEAYYYLCGNQQMIHEVYELLLRRNIPANHIFSEAFF